jgi:hypothetical protein
LSHEALRGSEHHARRRRPPSRANIPTGSLLNGRRETNRCGTALRE